MMHTPRKRFAPLIVLVAAALALAGCGSSGADASGGAEAELKLAIGTPSWNAGFAPLAVAEAEEYFAEENLKVTVELFPSGTQIAQQVVSGQADVGMVTPEPVAIGMAKDANLVYFAQYWTHWIYSISSMSADVKSLEDLPGKKVGVTAVASSGSTFMRTAMQMQGLDPESVSLVPIGGGAQQLNAIKSGEVDALAMWDTQYQIIQNAGVDLTPVPAPGTDTLFGGGFAVTAKTLEDKSDELTRMGRALAKAMVFSEANPEAAVKDLWTLHPESKGSSSADEDILLADQVKVLQVRMTDQKVSPDDDDRWGYIEPDSVVGTVDFMAASGLIEKKFDPEEIYTNDLNEQMNNFSYDDIRAAAEEAD